MLNNQSEIAIIGGGVVGLSVAIGLLQSGHKVIVCDGEDTQVSGQFDSKAPRLETLRLKK